MGLTSSSTISGKSTTSKHKIKFIPDSVNLNLDGFFFNSSFSVTDNKIKININYFFSKDLFTINQYSLLKDGFEKLAKMTDEWILLEVDQ